MTKHYQLFINGSYRSASSERTDASINPATGDVFATVDQANIADALYAVDMAEAAFQNWAQTAPSVREKILLQAAELVEKKAEALVDTLVDESGSTLLKARFEVHHSALFLRAIAGECRRVSGETYVSDYPGVKSYSIRKPLGVVLAISPFNFPLLLGIRKIAWALAAGNCVILKPSEVTPVVGLMLGEILSESGLPDGVLNVIPANASDLGDTLIADERIKKVTFTGSSSVGKLIAQQAAKYLKKFTMELGGKNPIIILNDVNLEYAVNTAVFSNFMHQGQVCMTGSRVIVESGIYDEFCHRVTEKVKRLKVGSPRDPEVVIGPLIRATQPPFIQSVVDQSVNAGARLMIGGSYEGNYYQPTVLADVTTSMDIFHTECFGPVMSIVKADDYLHALSLANTCAYGLSSAVMTNDLQKAVTLSEHIEAGMVHINGPTIRDEPCIPFGGMKDSGFGREGGRYAMEEFTEIKWITLQTGFQHYPF